MRSIRVYRVRIKINPNGKVSSHHFRAYMIKKFPDSKLVEYSGGATDKIRSTPLIQYKVLDSDPFIIAVEDGVDALKEVLPELSELYLGHNKYEIIEIEENETDSEIGVTTKRKKYTFETPWLALGDEDYGKFKYMYQQERDAALSKMLIRNILGLARTFKCEVDIRIKARHELKEIPPFKLGTSISGFVGGFETNFKIPEHLGIGNLSDRGFGSIIPK
ncbi:MAG: hypothetical protein IH825_01255 [Candidatus Marinimicrobia bacterium]|nr:hypothetical protein [Candidatus Neomarinimicrobiota bacterium]